jgi:hypothetical protein
VSVRLTQAFVSASIFRFNWDVAKYPLETPLKVTATTIQATVSKLEEGLKVL